MKKKNKKQAEPKHDMDFDLLIKKLSEEREPWYRPLLKKIKSFFNFK